MLMIIPGLYILYKAKKEIFWAILIYTLANIYVISTWSCWWYAASFSQRALVSSYPVMAILLGYFLTWLTSRSRLLQGLIGTLILALIILNIIQTIQYHRGILKNDRMTREYYSAIFCKLQGNPENEKLLLIERSAVAEEYLENEQDYSSRLLKLVAARDTSLVIGDSLIVQGLLLDSNARFSPAITEVYSNLTKKDHAWVRIEAKVFPLHEITENPFSIVAHVNHKGKPYKYRAYDSERMGISSMQWSHIRFDYLTPEVRYTSDDLNIYVWLRGNEPLMVDSIKVTLFYKD